MLIFTFYIKFSIKIFKKTKKGVVSTQNFAKSIIVPGYYNTKIFCEVVVRWFFSKKHIVRIMSGIIVPPPPWLIAIFMNSVIKVEKSMCTLYHILRWGAYPRGIDFNVLLDFAILLSEVWEQLLANKCDVFHLSDIFEKLSVLNKQLQGRDSDLISSKAALTAFLRKLVVQK